MGRGGRGDERERVCKGRAWGGQGGGTRERGERRGELREELGAGRGDERESVQGKSLGRAGRGDERGRRGEEEEVGVVCKGRAWGGEGGGTRERECVGEELGAGREGGRERERGGRERERLREELGSGSDPV